MSARSLFLRKRLLPVLISGLLAPMQVHAQLLLPALPNARSLPLQALPLDRAVQTVVDPVAAGLDSAGKTTSRALQISGLVHAHPRAIATDPLGNPVVRGQLLAQPSSTAALQSILQAGFSLIRSRQLTGLDLQLAVLAPPPSLSLVSALQKLRALDPDGHYDYNHIFTRSGDVAGVASGKAAATKTAGGSSSGGAVGLIDSGVDARHPVFRHTTVRSWGCGGARRPTAHGTAVASLLVGRSRHFHGADPGAPLYAADVYCNQPTGGSIDRILEACAWLSRQRVVVVNISLVGPPNILLQAALQRMSKRGELIVAAVGNDGPAAPPLYPAAYKEVVGVTAVDARDRVLVEAESGPQVAFAAPGADMAAAVPGGGFAPVRGTSFASPLVAGLLAAHLSGPGPDQAAQAIRQLTATAVDLGAPGRDDRYGLGLVGKELRIPVARLPHGAANNAEYITP